MSQSQFIRKAQPECLRYFLSRMNVNTNGVEGVRTATIEQLIAALIKEANFEKTMASEAVTNAVRDGLLTPVHQPNSVHSNLSRGRLHENKLVRLPEENEIAYSTHDCYCFECHLPGMLEQCTQCVRSFHRLCYRKDVERPNYSVPSAKFQKNRLPAFSSDTDSSDSDADGDASTVLDSIVTAGYESDIRASSSILQLDQSSLAGYTPPQRLIDEITVDSSLSPMPVLQQQQQQIDTELTFGAIKSSATEGKPLVEESFRNDDVETESKSKTDVVYLGEVRPPMRQRPATIASSISYKSEIAPAEEEEADLELCTCCRLLKIAKLRNPPNMQTDELCFLLSFTFERNRTWMGTDVPTFMKYMKFSTKDQHIVKKLLFKILAQHLDDIALKLQERRYSYLLEFLVDILDFQHSIGVFFGSQNTEIESTKWLVRDLWHDLSEIRRCPDCFRYSHEKESSAWFAKPCVQRHELVFAKHSGFCYWPAKVIRVLPNNKYDVRFFGGDHSRALIDVRYIRPIDTDTKILKLDNTPAIKRAMEELRYHQVLSTYPPSKFSFHADKEETKQIIHKVLAMDFSDGRNCSKGRRRFKRSNEAQIINVKLSENNNNNNIQVDNVLVDSNLCSDRNEFAVNETTQAVAVTEPENAEETSAKRQRTKNGVGNSEQPKRITRSIQNAFAPNDVKEILSDLQKATGIVNTQKLKNDKLLAQIKKLKETIKQHENEKRIMKRKQWCYWCLNEAVFLCCFRAAYCSKTCQSRHWKDGHSKVCKNENLNHDLNTDTADS